jgi:hypothetical protein
MNKQTGRCMMGGCSIVWGNLPCMEDCCVGWKPETEDEYWVRILQGAARVSPEA